MDTLHRLNTVEMSSRMNRIKYCSPLLVFAYQGGTLALVTLLVLQAQSGWMLAYAALVQAVALTAIWQMVMLHHALQPLVTRNATQWVEEQMQHYCQLRRPFVWLCGLALVASALGVGLTCVSGAPFCLPLVPLLMVQPIFMKLRAWSRLVRRACVSRHFESYSRYHPMPISQ